MEFIGITGGVGAGKSMVLSFLSRQDATRVVLADELAAQLTGPHGRCLPAIRAAFAGEDIYTPSGELDRERMAKVIFSDDKKRDRINEIVHPAVKEEILAVVAAERKKGELSYLFFEAALLLEDGYDRICDRLWYIYASETTRRKRLRQSRGYSDEKVDAICASQLSEAEFRRRCQVVIDNDGEPEQTYVQIRRQLCCHTQAK